jgi:hypothetical protein
MVTFASFTKVGQLYMQYIIVGNVGSRTGWEPIQNIYPDPEPH